MTTPHSPLDFDEELSQPLPIGRTFFNQGMTALAFILTGLALLPLLAILLEILRQGLPQLGLEVMVSLPAPVGMKGVSNGFANAIVGTLILVGIASIISVPFGVMTGILLSEFGKKSAIASAIRFITLILSSVPSIVVGVFAYAVIVLVTKKFSAVAGGFALGVVMLPVVALTTEEALKLVPTPVRLASAALGGSRFQTTFRVVVASALPGITTGILLAIARAAGETAPLLLTAMASTQNWPSGLFGPTPALSAVIYNYSLSPYPEQQKLAWTASLVLLGMVLMINIVSRLVTSRRLKTN